MHPEEYESLLTGSFSKLGNSAEASENNNHENIVLVECKKEIVDVNDKSNDFDNLFSFVQPTAEMEVKEIPLRNNRSEAWSFFRKQKVGDNIRAKCMFCEMSLAFNGGTTNLIKHLLKHQIHVKTAKHQELDHNAMDEEGVDNNWVINQLILYVPFTCSNI